MDIVGQGQIELPLNRVPFKQEPVERVSDIGSVQRVAWKDVAGFCEVNRTDSAHMLRVRPGEWTVGVHPTIILNLGGASDHFLLVVNDWVRRVILNNLLQLIDILYLKGLIHSRLDLVHKEVSLAVVVEIVVIAVRSPVGIVSPPVCETGIGGWAE